MNSVKRDGVLRSLCFFSMLGPGRLCERGEKRERDKESERVPGGGRGEESDRRRAAQTEQCTQGARGEMRAPHTTDPGLLERHFQTQPGPSDREGLSAPEPQTKARTL